MESEEIVNSVLRTEAPHRISAEQPSFAPKVSLSMYPALAPLISVPLSPSHLLGRGSVVIFQCYGGASGRRN